MTGEEEHRGGGSGETEEAGASGDLTTWSTGEPSVPTRDEHLRAVRQLRDALLRVPEDAPLGLLVEVLSEAERDIVAEGRIARDRLFRLIETFESHGDVPPATFRALWRVVRMNGDRSEGSGPADGNAVVPHDVHVTDEPPVTGHTPPGPSTGSDDDEWPDPADG